MMENGLLYSNLEKLTVGEIVAQNYHAAGVFRKFGLDFCCGGNISLEEACKKHRIDTEKVTDELRQILWDKTSTDDNYQAWEPDFLINHIENTHHRFVRAKTDEIAGYAAKVAGVHGKRHPENVEIYYQFTQLSKELMQHLVAEEETVFPLINEIYSKRMRGETVENSLVDKLRRQLLLMEGDHDGAGAVMASIRSLSNNFTPPEDACATYRILYQNLAGFEEDLHKHVHLENNILFKKAEKLI